MKPGDIVLIRFPQADLQAGKLRPASEFYAPTDVLLYQSHNSVYLAGQCVKIIELTQTRGNLTQRRKERKVQTISCFSLRT